MLKNAAKLSADEEYFLVCTGSRNGRPTGARAAGLEADSDLDTGANGIDLTGVIVPDNGARTDGTTEVLRVNETLAPGAWVEAVLRLGTPEAPMAGYGRVTANSASDITVQWTIKGSSPGPVNDHTSRGWLHFEDWRKSSDPNRRVLVPYLPVGSSAEDTTVAYPSTAAKKLSLPGSSLPASASSFEDLGILTPLSLYEGINGPGVSHATRTILDTAGPGVGTYQSSKFTAAVNGTSLYCYGYAQTTNMPTEDWLRGSSPEQSWVNICTTVAVEVDISLASGSITSAIVYPKAEKVAETLPDDPYASVVWYLDSGSLKLIAPPNVRLRIEVNGDRTEAMHVFTAPVKDLPAARTDYTTLGQTVSSVDTGADTITFGSPHGLSDGDRILLKSTGTRPGTAAGELEAWRILRALVSSPTVIQVEESLGTGALDLTTAGSGTITAWPGEWTDTANALYLPAGEHVIGRLFKLHDATTLFLDSGCVAVGSIDHILAAPSDPAAAITITGNQGHLAGTFITREDAGIDAGDYFANVEWAMFVGGGIGIPGYGHSTLSNITVFASPWHCCTTGIWSLRNLHYIAPWKYATGEVKAGERTQALPRESEVVDCFSFAGDDAFCVDADLENQRLWRCFAVNSRNSCYRGNYFPPSANQRLYGARMQRCHAVHLGHADTDVYGDNGGPDGTVKGGNTVLKCFMDGSLAQGNWGHANVEVERFFVWGPLASRWFGCGNTRNPYNNNGQDAAGQLYGFTLNNVFVESTPGQKAFLVAESAGRAPWDFTFANVEIGGVVLDDDNKLDHFELSPWMVRILFQEAARPIEALAEYIAATDLTADPEAQTNAVTAVGAGSMTVTYGVADGALDGGFVRVEWHDASAVPKLSWARIQDNQPRTTLTLDGSGWQGDGTPSIAGAAGIDRWMAWAPHHMDSPASYLPGEGFDYPGNDMSPYSAGRPLVRCRPRGVLARGFQDTLGEVVGIADRVATATGKRINLVLLAVDGASMLQTNLTNDQGFSTVCGWYRQAKSGTFHPDAVDSLYDRLEHLIQTVLPNAMEAEGNTKALKCLGIVHIQGEEDDGDTAASAAYEADITSYAVALRATLDAAGYNPFRDTAAVPFVQARIPTDPYEITDNPIGPINQGIVVRDARDEFGLKAAVNDITRLTTDPSLYDGAGEAALGGRIGGLLSELIYRALSHS